MTHLRLMKCIAVVMALAVPMSAVADSLLNKLLRIAGLTAAPGQLRSDDVEPGSIWVANLERGTVTRLTADSGYRSPVFSPVDGGVFALKGDAVVRIPSEGSPPAAIQRVTGAVKLIGFDSRNPDEIVILLEDGSSSVAVLSLKNGKVTMLPYDVKSEDQRRILAQIRDQDRVYGTTRVYLKTERKQGLSRAIEWTDVYLRRGDSTPQNVSACDGVSCAQPALSPDGKRVAFVKAGD
jgi:Tol biopolymer transport system component